MKKILYLSYVLLFSTVVFFSGCKEDDDVKTPEQAQTEKLAYRWMASSILHNGAPAAGFEEFRLTFTRSNTYSSTTGYPVFRDSGTWRFKMVNGAPQLNVIVLDGNSNLELTVNELTKTQLKATINITSANARVSVVPVEGEYVFNLIPSDY